MIRSTKQRALIREIFEAAERPLSPQDVVDAVQERDGAIGIATVYRNLKRLREEGWLVTVELPGQPACYERAEHDHHHHFQCDSCGTIYDVPGCANLRELTHGMQDFEVLRHEIWLFGKCATCK